MVVESEGRQIRQTKLLPKFIPNLYQNYKLFYLLTNLNYPTFKFNGRSAHKLSPCTASLPDAASRGDKGASVSHSSSRRAVKTMWNRWRVKAWQGAGPKDLDENRLGKQRIKVSVVSLTKSRIYAFCARYH